MKSLSKRRVESEKTSDWEKRKRGRGRGRGREEEETGFCVEKNGARSRAALKTSAGMERASGLFQSRHLQMGRQMDMPRYGLAEHGDVLLWGGWGGGLIGMFQARYLQMGMKMDMP